MYKLIVNFVQTNICLNVIHMNSLFAQTVHMFVQTNCSNKLAICTDKLFIIIIIIIIFFFWPSVDIFNYCHYACFPPEIIIIIIIIIKNFNLGIIIIIIIIIINDIFIAEIRKFSKCATDS